LSVPPVVVSRRKDWQRLQAEQELLRMPRLFMLATLALLSIAGAPAQAATAPVCGDVNSNGSISSSDALLVLKKGVGQAVTLQCTAYDDRISQLESDLATCQAEPVCGDGTIKDGEDCDKDALGTATCQDRGYAGGELACSTGCTYDESGCWDQRFSVSGPTILDHQTGLEWEKKDDLDSTANLANPHDADNAYAWSLTADGGADGAAFTDFLNKLNTAWSLDGASTTGCYGGHCDWRVPTIEELRTILDETCDAPPCVVDPVFAQTRQSVYWSISTLAGKAGFAWGAHFKLGTVDNHSKTDFAAVRAVRGGSAGSSIECDGTQAFGRCWFFGEDNQSCDDVCGANGSLYDTATLSVAGSDGSDATCLALMDLLGTPGSGLTWPSTTYSSGIGCAMDPTNARARVVTPATVSDAKDSGIRRLCACLKIL